MIAFHIIPPKLMEKCSMAHCITKAAIGLAEIKKNKKIKNRDSTNEELHEILGIRV